jgi:hypothetical protein
VNRFLETVDSPYVLGVDPVGIPDLLGMIAVLATVLFLPVGIPVLRFLAWRRGKGKGAGEGTP